MTITQLRQKSSPKLTNNLGYQSNITGLLATFN
jgi:hypothetical protein